jgi:pyruvate dehydrogenase E2 component (dihydrolipoamide acetyltransferase)
MATPVIMPKQGQSVESCIITKWHKNKGDKVSEGDMLFTYETDKATFDEESKVSGTVLELFFEEGDDVPCLTNVLVIGEEGEDPSPFRPAGDDEESAEAAAEEVIRTEAAPVITENKSDVLKASPRAKNLADRAGVAVNEALPTGPSGRIIARDVEALIQSGKGFLSAAKDGYAPGMAGSGIGGRVRAEDLESAPAPAAAPAPSANQITQVPVSNIRKVIARAMHESLSTMAQLTLNSSFDAAEIMAYRAKVKLNREGMGLSDITLNDIVLYAVSRVLLNHKDINANFTGDAMLYFSSVNLGMAVDTPRGLMVPTIFGASEKSLDRIAAESKELAASCQNGTINPDSLRGGSFTVTNLGALGIESFTPVINPPQTAILGVNNITAGIREVGGEIKAYKKMGLSLTFDHRAVDGAPAARFLKDLAFALENFSVLLAK